MADFIKKNYPKGNQTLGKEGIVFFKIFRNMSAMQRLEDTSSAFAVIHQFYIS